MFRPPGSWSLLGVSVTQVDYIRLVPLCVRLCSTLSASARRLAYQAVTPPSMTSPSTNRCKRRLTGLTPPCRPYSLANAIVHRPLAIVPISFAIRSALPSLNDPVCINPHANSSAGRARLHNSRQPADSIDHRHRNQRPQLGTSPAPAWRKMGERCNDLEPTRRTSDSHQVPIGSSSQWPTHIVVSRAAAGSGGEETARSGRSRQARGCNSPLAPRV